MLSSIRVKPIIRTAAFVIILAAVVAGGAFAQEIPSDTWMGIYLGQSKIGYARFRIDKADHLGKQGYRLDSLSVTRIVAMGTEVEQTLDTSVYLDKSFAPTYQIFKMSSGGHTTTVTAVFDAKEITAQTTSEGSKTIKRIPIPPGSKIVGDNTYIPNAPKMKIGDKSNFKCFNPLTLSLDDLQTEVLRKEMTAIGGESWDAFVVKSTSPLGDMTCWQNDKGEVLKVIALMGITMLREPKDAAQSLADHSGAYTPPADLAVITSAQTTTKIPYPRYAKYMKAQLSGLNDKSLAINDNRQQVTHIVGDNPSTVYEIHASELDFTKAVNLPIKDSSLDKYLADSTYIQPSNQEIVDQAKKIAGQEKNSAKVVSQLRGWVNANMTAKGDIGIMRSSVDVLHARTGVCRDYAVLYASLARASGIPTKLVAGLVYWEGGFYYHAWAESYIGWWVPLDATVSTDFVDATHIKLAEGEASAMFDMVKTMGNLKAVIEEFK